MARDKTKLYRLCRRQEWKCHYCGCQTFLRKKSERHKPQPTDATIEHLDGRYSAERGKHWGEYRLVMACWKCNNEKNAEQQRTVPIEELRARSGRHPRQGATP